MSLEKQLKEVEEKLYTTLEVEVTSRVVSMTKAKQMAVADFKELEEYKFAT